MSNDPRMAELDAAAALGLGTALKQQDILSCQKHFHLFLAQDVIHTPTMRLVGSKVLEPKSHTT